MKSRDAVFMFAVLMLVCAALLYLDWRRQGEIELLHVRIDSLERRPLVHPQDGEPTGRENPEPLHERSTFQRILHASDDRTLADIARGNV